MTETDFPDGGTVSYAYNTGNFSPWTISSTTTVASGVGQNSTTTATLDGLGRTVTVTSTDPNNAVSGVHSVDTVYDALGRLYSVTNPYFATSDQTYGLTYYNYDALGRVTQIQHPSGKTETFTFNKRAVKHVKYPTDNAFTKVYQSDGLGRLTDICEVTGVTQANGQAPSPCQLDITATGFHATNSYDALGNILSMNYSSVRSFTYDALSRLTSATYPESGTPPYAGTITYVYDTGTAGDLYQRIAPAPNQTGSSTVTTTYTHDAMHRLTGITYSDGTTPAIAYNYDQSSVWSHTLTNPKGRLTSASGAGVVNAVFGYDKMGRVVLHGQCTPLNCGTTNFFANYSYNYIGEPLGGADYLGITWTNTYNNIGQLSQVTTNWLSPTQSGTIVSGITYNALGEPTLDQLGDGKTESWNYNRDGHPTSFSGGASPGYNNTTTWLGDLITSSTDNVNGNWTYTYDDFARLNSAVQSGGQSFNYSYDEYANRWGTISGVNQFTFNGATNRITSGGITYDSAGNMTYDGFHTYTYDGENRLKQVDSGSTAKYGYDPFGNRSMQYAPPVYNEYVNDLTGRAITAIHPGTSLVYTAEVFAGGRHWTTDNGSALFIGADWVGTSRALTNLSGTFDQLYTSLPWGDALTFSGGSGYHTTSHFTDKEYDPESNLYHFPARQYAPVQGRWLTPDPGGLAVLDPSNPQSWNRYAYVMNNPVTNTDPSGLVRLAPCDPEGDGPCGGGGGGTTCDPFEGGCNEGCDVIVDPFCNGGNGGGGGGWGGGGGGGSRGGGIPRQNQGGNHGPWPENQTTGLPQLPTQPLSLDDLLGLSPGCDFGVCDPIGNGFAPGELTWPLPTLTRICVAVPGCVQIATGILIGITLVLQKGDQAQWSRYPECSAQYDGDRAICQQRKTSSCWQSAADRLAACNASGGTRLGFPPLR